MTFKSLQQNREKEMEKLMTLDVMSYSTMSGHPQCKIDPYKLKSFHAESMKAVLEWVVGEIEGMKNNTILPSNPIDYGYEDFSVKAYNTALTDLKSRLEEGVKEIL